MGAEIHVAMTPAGAKFVSPMTFRAALSAPVVVEQFAESIEYNINHVSWARWADIIIVAPATANTMAKVAMGIADNFLTATILAADKPIAFVPAMNSAMFKNYTTQRNIHTLEEMGCYVMLPESGELACGESGPGRFPQEGKIIEFIREILIESAVLKGKRILITAGPTREFIDPVRFISNPSTGRMGFAIADFARMMGADVVLVHGCLLYTSPSPRDLSTSRMPSSA